jgi:hypothetical protein
MSYRKERKQLASQLAQAKADNPTDSQARSLEVDLRILDSNQLWRRAMRWGLSRSDIGPWESDRENTRLWLRSDERFAEANKRIDEARYAVVKKWVDLLIPIASLVISLVALVIAAMALRS